MKHANAVTLPVSTYTPAHFLLAVEDGVARVTLNRPEKKNPLTFESYRELTDFFQALAKDDSVGAVLLSGAGGNFSSGGDVFEIIGPLTRIGYLTLILSPLLLIPNIYNLMSNAELLFTPTVLIASTIGYYLSNWMHLWADRVPFKP
jgi:1,4-dihydroxy-2-naphthoyl-CoA synthase